MNEYDLVFAWSEIGNHLWSVIQFFASISFGLIIVAHAASSKLNQYLVWILSVLYSLFSFYAFMIIASDLLFIGAVYEEALQFVEQNENVSITILALSDYLVSPLLVGIIFSLLLITTYTCALGYLVYSYKRKLTDN